MPLRRATDETVPVDSEAQRKAKKNAQQKAYRSTPEGRAAANEASKKSHALAKERTEAIKAFMAERVAASLAALKAKGTI